MFRDGVVRVGEEVETEKLEELDVDQWMTGPWAGQQHTDNLNKLKLYAYACRSQLGTNTNSTNSYPFVKSHLNPPFLSVYAK